MAAAIATSPALAAEPPADCQELIARQPDDWHSAAELRIDGSAISSPEDLAAIVARAPDSVHVIAGGRFAGWDFTGIEQPMRGLCFYATDLSGTRWDGRDLAGSAFVLSDLSGAQFREANLARVRIHDTRLAGTGMRRAELSEGMLTGGWFTELSDLVGRDDVATSLEGWDLGGAKLTRFRFDCTIEIGSGCPLERTIDMSLANLAAADLSSFPGWGAFNLAGAMLDGTMLAPDQLVYFADAVRAGPVVLVGGDSQLALDPAETLALTAAYQAAAEAEDLPSFPCDAAVTLTERLLCSEAGREAGLPELDRRLAEAFAEARQRDPRILAAQRAWLRQRDRCGEPDCVAGLYEQRLSVLLAQADPPDWLKPGMPQVFIEERLVPADIAGAPGLLARVTPLLVKAADQRIIVTREADGTLSVRGEAIAANAHTCTLDAGRLRMDRATGWYSLILPGKRPVPVLRLLGRELEIYANGRPDYDAWPDVDHVSCGARAAFVTSRHLATDPALARGLLQWWSE